MKLRAKKIIASEFLTLIVITLLSLLCGVCIYPYNSFRQSQINSTQKEIAAQTKNTDSLSYSYNKKQNTQKTFFAALSSEFTLSNTEENTTEGTWKGLGEAYRSESIPIRYEKKWDTKLIRFIQSRGFNDGKAFEKFVGESLISKKDSLNYLQSEKVNQTISELEIQSNHFKSKIFDSNEQIKFSLLILIILLSIAYPLRFLILGIKWSFKTIRQKD